MKLQNCNRAQIFAVQNLGIEKGLPPDIISKFARKELDHTIIQHLLLEVACGKISIEHLEFISNLDLQTANWPLRYKKYVKMARKLSFEDFKAKVALTILEQA